MYVQPRAAHTVSVLTELGGKAFSSYTVTVTTMRYDTMSYFDMRSKSDTSQLNLPHGAEAHVRSHSGIQLPKSC